MEKTKTKLSYYIYGIEVIIILNDINSLNRFFKDTYLLIPDLHEDVI